MYRFALLFLFVCTCGPRPGAAYRAAGSLSDHPPVVAVELLAPPPDYDTTEWTELIRLDSTIALELRYATTDNFMERKIYDCGRCFYRPKVARALADAQQELTARGLGLKLYDCYRPGPYQQRLWDVLPDARYVANPKRGSLHSRGLLPTSPSSTWTPAWNWIWVPPYDFFGEAAYTTTTDLPADVLQNRAILQDVLLRYGFATIRTEWWHFNFTGPRYPLSEWTWDCAE